MNKILPFVLFILVSCGNLNGQMTKLVLKIGPQSSDSKNSEQILLYGVHGDTTFALPLLSSTTDTTIELAQGIWDFYVIHWGSGSLSTEYKCETRRAALTQPEQTINLVANSLKCNDVPFTRPAYIFNSAPAPIRIYSCTQSGQPPTPGCSTSTFSYRIQLLGRDIASQDYIPGINSDCLSIGTSSPSVNLPLGIDITSPFRTVIWTYASDNCDPKTEQFSYVFPNGLLGGSTVPRTRIEPPVDGITTVYLLE